MKRLASFVFVVLAAACSKNDPAAGPKATSTASRAMTLTTTSAEARKEFRLGRRLYENVRAQDAKAHFQKAVELDPKFGLARAYLGNVTRGPEGDKLLAEATTLAESASKPERVLIGLLQAQRKIDLPKARALRARLGDLVPGDWRVQTILGHGGFVDRKWPEAIAALKRAIALNPKAGQAYNLIAYAYANTDRFDEAIAAAKKYAELQPKEPNPHDTLGEILLFGKRFDESAAAFLKAAELEPSFWLALEGAAVARFLKGDWEEGRKILAQARTAARAPRDKLWIDIDVAKSYEAEGKYAEAIEHINAMEKAAKAQSEAVRYLWAPAHRATILLESKKPAEALRELDLAFRRKDQPGIPDDQRRDLDLRGNLARAWAYARLGNAAEAQKAADAVTQAAQRAGDPFIKGFVPLASATVAAARRDWKAAVESLSKVEDEHTLGLAFLARAQEKAGDAGAAAATRERIRRKPQRNLLYVSIVARLPR